MAAEGAGRETPLARHPLLDRLDFGDARSEAAHRLRAEHDRSALRGGGRVALPLDPPTARLADLDFRIRVDAGADTYLTLELSGDDDSPLKTLLLVDGVLAGYRQFGDHEPIDTGTRAPLPGRRFLSTALLPPALTRGRAEVTITLRTYSADYRPLARDAGYELAETPSRRYLRVWTSTEAAAPLASAPAPAPPARRRLTPAEERERVVGLRARQLELVRELEEAVDAGDPSALSLSRYRDGLRFYADALRAPWSPATRPEQKRAALQRIFAAVDAAARDYHRDVRLAANGGHQSDWGGYFSVIGEALYTVEPLLDDAEVLGRDAFEAHLDEPLPIEASGPFSRPGRAADGGPLRRREAWERMLRASFDFARSRLSYIFNQVMLTYEGAWRAHEGLRIVGSAHYEGPERSHRILREAYGIAEFLGEEVLTDGDGRLLDLNHSLFQHDRNAVYTDDVVDVVLRGEAHSARDADGGILRRRPYGDHYRGLTDRGLSRENNYVGVYGELILLIVARIHRLADHPQDAALRDDLIRAALLNGEARGQFRYSGVDPDGTRAMLLEQVIDERTSAYPGRVAYSAEAVSGSALLWAGLERVLHEGGDRYRGDEWRESWARARRLVGWTQQMLLDDQFLPAFADGNDIALRADLRILESYDWVTRDRAVVAGGRIGAGEVMPHTDLTAYTDDELAAFGVDRAREPHTRCWVDVDAAAVSLRHGDVHAFVALTWRNVGFTGVGRAHLMHGGTDQLVQFATEAELSAEETYLRGETREAWRQSAPDAVGEDRDFAWTGQLIPVARQPAVGSPQRDNWAVDTPFSARADLLAARIGELFVALNTTSDELGNARSIEVELPGPPATANLADGPVVGDDRRVSVPPGAAVVVLLSEPAPSGGGDAAPRAVPVALALTAADRTALSWPRVTGAARYRVSADGPDGAWQREVADDGRTPHLILPGAGGGLVRIEAESAAGRAGPAHRIRVDAAGDSRWSRHLIGGARGDILTADDGVRFRIEGGGFAGGDDARLHLRHRPDAIAVAAGRLATGDVEASASVLERFDGFAGLMLRDGMGAVARYVALGLTDAGLELRTRTLDTREDYGIGNPGDDAAGGRVRSPTVERIAVESPIRALRLTRDHASARVVAAVQMDDRWHPVWCGIVPMLPPVAVGVCATGSATVRLWGGAVSRPSDDPAGTACR